MRSLCSPSVSPSSLPLSSWLSASAPSTGKTFPAFVQSIGGARGRGESRPSGASSGTEARYGCAMRSRSMAMGVRSRKASSIDAFSDQPHQPSIVDAAVTDRPISPFGTISLKIARIFRLSRRYGSKLTYSPHQCLPPHSNMHPSSPYGSLGPPHPSTQPQPPHSDT